MNRRPRSYQERALPLSYVGLSLLAEYIIAMVEGVGFEPTKPFRAPDLQSGGLSHSPTPPACYQFNTIPISSQYPPGHDCAGEFTPGDPKKPQGGFEPTNLPITNRLRYHCATGARWVAKARLQRGPDGSGPRTEARLTPLVYEAWAEKSIRRRHGPGLFTMAAIMRGSNSNSGSNSNKCGDPGQAQNKSARKRPWPHWPSPCHRLVTALGAWV